MAETPDISPNDKDLLLAKEIGQSLPDLQDAASTSNDPLLSTLLEYKYLKHHSSQDIASSESIWNAIEQEIGQNTAKSRIFNLTPSTIRYAVAATILLAAFIGVFFYQNLTKPELIAASQASSTMITLSDGSEVTLRPYSKFFELKRSEENQKYKLEGEAYFNVSENQGRIFSVQTGRSEVRVLGTRFVLSDWGNISTVYLQEGRIEYASLITNKAIELKPGQSSTLDLSNTMIVEDQANEIVYTDWLNGELVFENEPVRNIFQELEQHFNIIIEVQNVDLDEQLSGSLALDNADSVLQDLEVVLNGTFTKNGQRSYLFNLD
jgi:ferric-dicitrate binding protein FerR (iron transport regulator)